MGNLVKAPVQGENVRLHHDFCSDLSIKASYQQDFGYQPRFALFKVQSRGLTTARAKVEEEGQHSMVVPLDTCLEVFDLTQIEQVLTQARNEEEDLEKTKWKL